MEWVIRNVEQHNAEFIILLILLLALGVMRQNEGERLMVFVRSFINPSLLNQQLREERAFNRIALPIFITIVFVLAYFLALAFERLEVIHDMSFTLRFLLISVVLIAITAFRGMTYYFFGLLFNLKSVLQAHTTNWLLNNFVLSLIILPLSVLLAFGPTSLAQALSFIGLGILGLFYLIRSFRLFGLSQQEIHVPILYNVLYLCALEILPPILIAVAIARQAG